MQHQHQHIRLSVIIPCYNEENNLAQGSLDEVYAYLARQSFSWQVIIVNDDSTDNSRMMVEEFMHGREGMELLDIPHGGKPAAVWTGIQHASGDIVLLTDMDQSTPLEEFDKLSPWYDRGFDVVIGSRGHEREGFSRLRKSGSTIFRFLRRLVLLPGIQDTQCGFKSCRRQAALHIFPHLQIFQHIGTPSGWKVSAYDVELLYLFEKAGYAIQEVPVRWWNRDRSNTKTQTREFSWYVHESAEMAQEVLRVKWNEWKGTYD